MTTPVALDQHAADDDPTVDMEPQVQLARPTDIAKECNHKQGDGRQSMAEDPHRTLRTTVGKHSNPHNLPRPAHLEQQGEVRVGAAALPDTQ